MKLKNSYLSISCNENQSISNQDLFDSSTFNEAHIPESLCDDEK